MSDVLQEIRQELDAVTVWLPTSREVLRAIDASTSKQKQDLSASGGKGISEVNQRHPGPGIVEGSRSEWEDQMHAREAQRKVEARPFESEQNPLYIPSKWSGSLSHLRPLALPTPPASPDSIAYVKNAVKFSDPPLPLLPPLLESNMFD